MPIFPSPFGEGLRVRQKKKGCFVFINGIRYGLEKK